MLGQWTTPWSIDLSFKTLRNTDYKSHPEQTVPHPYSVKANQKSDRFVTQCYCFLSSTWLLYVHVVRIILRILVLLWWIVVLYKEALSHLKGFLLKYYLWQERLHNKLSDPFVLIAAVQLLCDLTSHFVERNNPIAAFISPIHSSYFTAECRWTLI